MAARASDLRRFRAIDGDPLPSVVSALHTKGEKDMH